MHRSWFMPLARVAAPLALATLAACGSDSSTGTTGGGLTTSQRTTLTQTLGRQDIVAAITSAGNPFISYGVAAGSTLGLNSVGTITIGTAPSANRLVPTVRLALSPSATTIAGPTGTYKAFGAQLILKDSTPEEVAHAVWTGFVAFDNLDNPGALIVAGVFTGNATSITTIPSTNFGGDEESSTFAAAAYIKITGTNTSTVYSTVGESGSVGSIAITSASFSGATGCGVTLPTFITYCGYGSGTIAGSFGFTATDINGTDTVTIPTTTVNVPASQTSLSFDESLIPQQ